LIKHRVLPISEAGEPIPDFVMYGKKMREGQVPPNIYKKYGWATHQGFNEDIGLKMTNVECEKKDWKELSILFSHLDSLGELRKILRKGFI